MLKDMQQDTNALQTHPATSKYSVSSQDQSESANRKLNLHGMLCNASRGPNHSTVKQNKQTDASMLNMHQHLLF